MFLINVFMQALTPVTMVTIPKDGSRQKLKIVLLIITTILTIIQIRRKIMILIFIILTITTVVLIMRQ